MNEARWMRGSFHLDVVNALAALDDGVHRLSLVIPPLLLLLLAGRCSLSSEDLRAPVVRVWKKIGNRNSQCFDANASGLS